MQPDYSVKYRASNHYESPVQAFCQGHRTKMLANTSVNMLASLTENLFLFGEEGKSIPSTSFFGEQFLSTGFKKPNKNIYQIIWKHIPE